MVRLGLGDTVCVSEVFVCAGRVYGGELDTAGFEYQDVEDGLYMGRFCGRVAKTLRRYTLHDDEEA